MKTFVIKQDNKTYAVVCTYNGKEFDVKEYQTNHKKVKRLPNKVEETLMGMACNFYYKLTEEAQTFIDGIGGSGRGRE